MDTKGIGAGFGGDGNSASVELCRGQLHADLFSAGAEPSDRVAAGEGESTDIPAPNEVPLTVKDEAELVEAMKASFTEQPANPEGDPDGNGLLQNETLSPAAEGEGHEENDAVALEPATLNDAAEADDIDQSEGNGATGASGNRATTVPVTLRKNRRAKLQHGGVLRVIGAAAASASADDDETSNGSSNEAEAADDDEGEETGQLQLFKQAVGSLLDESTGELKAPEDFEHKVDDRAFENEWLGTHTDLSLAVFTAQLLKTGKHTDDVDEKGKLLSDPVKRSMARDIGARITLRVHRGLSPAQKRDFILRAQARGRIRTAAEDRELKRRIVVVGLELGFEYEKIAKMAGVCTQTARNIESREAADPNSKLLNAKRPDGRFKPATREKIAQAGKLRAEGKSNAEIAKIFGTDLDTVGKWFKDPSARTNGKGKPEAGKKAKAKRAAAAQSAEAIEDIAAVDGVPELHWLVKQHTQAYIDRLKACAAEARKEVDAASDIDELLNLSLRFSQGVAFAELRLRKMLSRSGALDVEAAATPGGSSPGKSGNKPDNVLLGIVMADETDEVFVAMPVGGGVIDNRDNCLDWHAPLEVGGVVRVRVEGFDSKRGLWKLQPQARQTPAPAPGAIAGSHRDKRCSPFTELAGRKAGPKGMGVTK
jgi:transposase